MRMKFTDIVEFSGKTCSTFDGKKNYISTGCVHDNHICKDEIETVEYINKPSRANLVVEPGDILFAKMQATKKTLLINEDLSQNIYSTGFYAVKPKDGLITKKCLFYLINSSLFLGEKDKNCSGATQKAINNQGLSSIELNIPEFSVQKLLTQKLDVLSKAIEVKQSQIRFFDNLIKARFVEMFGNVVINDKHWPTEPMSKVAPTNSPKIKNNETVWLLNLDMIESQSGKVIDKLIVSKDKINASTCAFDENNVLYSKLRPYLNKVVLPDQVGYCTTELVPLKPGEELTREFLATLLRSDAFVSYINEKTAGAKMPRVSMNIFRQFECVIPPIALQQQFSELYKHVDKSKFVLSNELTMCDFYIRLIHDRVMHSRINLRVAQ